MDSSLQSTEPRRVTRGFFPIVAGTDVRVERGGGMLFFARRQLKIERGGGQWLVSTGDLKVQQGGGMALVAKNATVQEGFVGVLAAVNAGVAPGTRVLLRVTPAVAIAAAASFLAGWLVGRRRAHRPVRALVS